MGNDLPRLSDTLLSRLRNVRCPAYDRADVSLGIVHVGLGAFHRAHQAVYTDDRLAAGERDWGICGLNLRSPDVRASLAPQHGLYTVLERGSDGDRARVIGAVKEALTVPETSARALDRLTDPATRIISLTVTEKAYCQEAGTGTLDETHPEITADLAGDRFPRTVPGLLVEALARRRAAGVKPCTVLVCDNLPSNGATVARIVTRYAERRDPDLAHYVAGEIAFPCTMVDRIVPATTDADRAAVESYGYRDAWPVVGEPFTQWVIEDRFAAGRPLWEEAGAQIVPDVHPFELAKLRLLNGAHSTLAYLGTAFGLETVSDAMTEPTLAAFLRRLWDEDLAPTLQPVPGLDVAHYLSALEMRFRNLRIRHRLLQIAMDGSQKLPPRLLMPAVDRLRCGAFPRRIALVVAGWMRFLLGADDVGRRYEISDPLASRLTEIAGTHGRDAEALVDTLLAVRDVFDPALAQVPGFRREVRAALGSLLSRGASATLVEALKEPSGGGGS